MALVFMRILLFNKMCTSDVKVYLEKKFSGENLPGPAVPEAAVISVDLSATLEACRSKTRPQLSWGSQHYPYLLRVCMGLHHSPDFLVHICLSPASTFEWQSPVSSFPSCFREEGLPVARDGLQLPM